MNRWLALFLYKLMQNKRYIVLGWIAGCMLISLWLTSKPKYYDDLWMFRPFSVAEWVVGTALLMVAAALVLFLWFMVAAGYFAILDAVGWLDKPSWVKVIFAFIYLGLIGAGMGGPITVVGVWRGFFG